MRISIHALLAESDAIVLIRAATQRIFLSTLSLRRATRLTRNPDSRSMISIHALLAESDAVAIFFSAQCCISIHALLAESDFSGSAWVPEFPISIHALLAESDGA